MSITPDELVNALVDTAQQYTDEFKVSLEEELEKIGKEAVEEVKTLSPKKTSKYRRGWRYVITKNRGAFKVTVHNKHYQLTHLLENGTSNSDGTKRSRAIPHISTANQHAEEKVNRLFERL